MKRPGDSLGPQSLLVEVTTIDGNQAITVDDFGQERTVRVDLLASHVRPAVGEQWIISRHLGLWTFALRTINPPVPVVSGSRASGAALRSLLDALESLGLIVNETTP